MQTFVLVLIQQKYKKLRDIYFNYRRIILDVLNQYKMKFRTHSVFTYLLKYILILISLRNNTW